MKKRSVKFTIRSLMKMMTSALLGLLLVGFFWVTENTTETSQPVYGSPPELYANQQRVDLRQSYLGAIDKAQHSILFIIYALTDDKIINALKKKADEGVDVRIIYDAKASPYTDRKLGSKVNVTKRFGDGLMHIKILCIDDTEVWLGSANMSSESLRMHANLVAAVISPEIAEMVTTKASGMGEYGRSAPVPHRTFLLGGQSVELWFLPDNSHAVLQIKDLIRSAKKTLRIAMFTWTREDFAKAVIDASKRGVDVQVAMDRSSAEGKGASNKIAEMLKKGGVSVHFNKGAALLHHKFCYIDSATLVNGSANWTKAAFTQNDDCFMIFHELTPKQTAYMDALWETIISESKGGSSR